MTPDKLQELRRLNEKRTKGLIQIFAIGTRQIMFTPDAIYEANEIGAKDDLEFLAALANNADWLLGCVEALQFYADEDTYAPGDRNQVEEIFYDNGDRARKALEGK